MLLRSSSGDYFRWGFTGDYVADCAGSLHAEALAFAHALDWVFTSLVDSVRPVHIYGDATAIGYGADGSQQIAKGLNDLGTLVRHMFCLTQSSLPLVEYHHVKAHSGQIDNELVDSLAKAIAKQTWSPHVGIPSLERWYSEPLLPWAWLMVENVRFAGSSLPQLDDLAAGRSFPGIPQGDFDPFGGKPEIKPGNVDFDLLSGDYDHFVIAMDLDMSLKPSSGVVRPRRALYDRKAARADPEKLRTMLESPPAVPWGVAADDHWHIIEEHCSKFLRRHFPLPKRQVRQEYFSEDTWRLLTARKDVEIQIKAADRRIAGYALYCAFVGWRSLLDLRKSSAEDAPVEVVSTVCLYQERALLLWVRGQLDSRFRSQRKQDLLSFRSTCSLNFSNQVRSGDTSSLFSSETKAPCQQRQRLQCSKATARPGNGRGDLW